MSDPFARYDIGLANPPEGGGYPLKCTDCGEHIFDVEDHAEGETHCTNPDEPSEISGTLQWDFGYDWRDDNPNIP